jgi:hypothetical protein
MTEDGYGTFLRNVVTKLQNTWKIPEEVVNPVNMPRAGRSGARIPGGTRVISSATLRDRLCDPTSILFKWYRLFFPGIRLLGHDVDSSLPSSSEFNKAWSFKSSPLNAFMSQIGTPLL